MVYEYFMANEWQRDAATGRLKSLDFCVYCCMQIDAHQEALWVHAWCFRKDMGGCGCSATCIDCALDLQDKERAGQDIFCFNCTKQISLKNDAGLDQYRVVRDNMPVGA
jgi:hypothetical protein